MYCLHAQRHVLFIVLVATVGSIPGWWDFFNQCVYWILFPSVLFFSSGERYWVSELMNQEIFDFCCITLIILQRRVIIKRSTKQLLLSLIGIILRWGFLIWELIFFIYCGLFVLILVVFFLCCFFFHYVSANFHLWPSSGDLPRPRIGMVSLVTVSPVITAFHCCCLSHHVFWRSKPLAGLGRIWNRYLLTMLTWNRRDSTPLSAAPRVNRGKSPDEGQRWKLAET